MTTTGTGIAGIDLLYRTRPGRVDRIDVPELGYLMLDGEGSPGAGGFAEAVGVLSVASYAARARALDENGVPPKVMPLEALWWFAGDGDDEAVLEQILAGEPVTGLHWHWRALMVQLPPVDADIAERAIAQTRERHPGPAADGLRYERWREGAAFQVLQLGPYSAESSGVRLLHDAIRAAGFRPRGRHHEIYLGDPRITTPQRLRTLLRQPVAVRG